MLAGEKKPPKRPQPARQQRKGPAPSLSEKLLARPGAVRCVGQSLPGAGRARRQPPRRLALPACQAAASKRAWLRPSWKPSLTDGKEVVASRGGERQAQSAAPGPSLVPDGKEVVAAQARVFR